MSRKSTTLKNFEDNGGLDTLVSNYYQEFYYTDRHVSLYNSSQYDILIYIQKNCLTELNLNFPVVDFGNCYSKVQTQSGLENQNLIVVILKKIDEKTGRSSSSYSLYNPKDGTKLDGLKAIFSYDIVTSKLGGESVGNLEFMLSYDFNLFIEKENKIYKSVRFL